MVTSKPDVAVLGGGLTGACLALELSQRGYRVHLYERECELLTRTATSNEGKVHLGYVYANSGSFRTAELMLRGAGEFFPNLARLLGTPSHAIPVSDPFVYLVHRDSMIGADEIFHHARRVTAVIERSPHFGEYPNCNETRQGSLLTPLSSADLAAAFNPEKVTFAFRTPEVSVDVQWIAARLRKRVHEDPCIEVLLNAEVVAAKNDGETTTVAFVRERVQSKDTYGMVVNALWEGRLKVDASLSFFPGAPCFWRVKYGAFLSGRLPRSLPNSFSVSLGPFGDFVNHDCQQAYVSWYPLCLGGSGAQLPDWRNELPQAEAHTLAHGSIAALADLAPHLKDLHASVDETTEVKGGAIFALGSTDIDDAKSRLHARDGCGIMHATRSYISLDPGKYTTAPYYAREVAEMIARIRPG